MEGGRGGVCSRLFLDLVAVKSPESTLTARREGGGMRREVGGLQVAVVIAVVILSVY